MYVDRFRDRYRLWQEKVGRTQAYVEPEDDDYERPMARGHRLEGVARLKYCVEQGVFAPPACLKNARPGETFMACSLDGWIAGDRIIEIKCPTDARTHLMARDGTIAEEYWIQTQHNMHVAEVERADFVSFFNGQLVIVPVEYDPDYLIEELLPAEKEFWSWVEAAHYPTPEQIVDLTTEADAGTMEALRQYLQYRRAREEAEEYERLALAGLKRRLTKVAIARAPGVRLQWEKRRGFIQYSRIPQVQELLKTAGDLSSYRGADSLLLRVDRL